MIKLYNENCMDTMKRIDNNSIDAIITDPPYGISFMNQKWDYSVPSVNIWQEALRILKPGAHILVACGTRTYHRMVTNIEDAGFNIRDCIVWAYGCLSEDTEIFTSSGWQTYSPLIVNQQILCFNTETNNFEWHKPKRDFVYKNKHTAYKIQSNHTDQIVSRNHRVLIERDGNLLFQTAEELAPQQEVDIPFLESLPSMPNHIPNQKQGTSNKKQNMLQRLCKKTKLRPTTTHQDPNPKEKTITNRMRHMWKTILQTYLSPKEIKGTFLFKTLQRCRQGQGLGETCPQRPSSMDRTIRKIMQRKNVGAKQSSMEGWRNILQKTWLLCQRQIYKVSNRIFANGTERWLCYGTPNNYGSTHREMLNTNGSSSPYQSRPNRQQNRKSNAISEQQTTQTIRSTRAKISPIEYQGNVWCVEVQTGAFVARRNGMIFITGNSGFPKSLNISKDIDRQLGCEREVVGQRQDILTKQAKDLRDGKRKILESYNSGANNRNNGFVTVSADITAPSSPQAKLFDGYHTALKPAVELWCLAQKPISEKNIAQNVLKWGTGGINVDGCRIGNETITYIKNKVTAQKWKEQDGRTNKIVQNDPPKTSTGRFPANLILSDDQEVLDLFPSTPVSHRKNPSSSDSSIFSEKGTTMWYDGERGYADSGSASRYFKITPNDRSRENCIQFSKNKHQFNYGQEHNTSAARFFYCAKATTKERNTGLNDTNNTHPTVKPLKLMQYLIRLISPPNNPTIYDPFMGSGSTGVAAILENVSFIGSELDTQYFDIAQQRINHTQQQIEPF